MIQNVKLLQHWHLLNSNAKHSYLFFFFFFFHSKDIFTILVDNKVHVLALVKFRVTVRILIFLYSVTYPIAECKDVYQGIVWNLLLLFIWLKCKTVLETGAKVKKEKEHFKLLVYKCYYAKKRYYMQKFYKNSSRLDILVCFFLLLLVVFVKELNFHWKFFSQPDALHPDHTCFTWAF